VHPLSRELNQESINTALLHMIIKK